MDADRSMYSTNEPCVEMLGPFFPCGRRRRSTRYKIAVARHAGEDRHEYFDRAAVKFRVRVGGKTRLVLVVVDKHEIEIGIVVDRSATELSKCENGHWQFADPCRKAVRKLLTRGDQRRFNAGFREFGLQVLYFTGGNYLKYIVDGDLEKEL